MADDRVLEGGGGYRRPTHREVLGEGEVWARANHEHLRLTSPTPPSSAMVSWLGLAGSVTPSGVPLGTSAITAAKYMPLFAGLATATPSPLPRSPLLGGLGGKAAAKKKTPAKEKKQQQPLEGLVCPEEILQLYKSGGLRQHCGKIPLSEVKGSRSCADSARSPGLGPSTRSKLRCWSTRRRPRSRRGTTRLPPRAPSRS